MNDTYKIIIRLEPQEEPGLFDEVDRIVTDCGKYLVSDINDTLGEGVGLLFDLLDDLVVRPLESLVDKTQTIAEWLMRILTAVVCYPFEKVCNAPRYVQARRRYRKMFRMAFASA